MRKKTVLVIEDNNLNRELITCLLEIGNFAAMEAVDAEEGIRVALKRKPDLILMDIGLPGMDGLTATRLIKANPELENIPVVALSGYAAAEDEQRALDAGCSGFMGKPINTRGFTEKMSGFINRGGPPPETDEKKG